MRTECGIAIFGTAAEENGARRTIREAKRMKSIRHGLVILTDASRCGDGGENANEKNNQGFGAERYMEAVRTLVQEYVFMAQKMQQPHPCDACCGSERGDNDDGEDAVVDQDTTGVAGTRLVLSINFVASYNAKAIACQQVEMERPVAVTRRNQRLLQGISRRVDDCLSCLKGQPSYHDDVEVSSAALVRALEWFKDSSFTVSVIAPSDSIPLRQVPSLASALTKLREVQFVLLRSDDERAVQSSQNILRLLRAIKRSENPMCGIRQIDNYALQLHGLTKEWIYRVAPSVSASVYYDGLPQSKGSPAVLAIDIRSNYLLPSRGSQMLHVGMSRLEIMHIVPMSTVHPSILMGCPLHGCPSLAATMPVDVAKNLGKVKALAHFLETELCGAILRCKLQIQSEFYLMVPSRGESVNVQFLFFRVASAEEVLVPPPEHCQTKAPLPNTVEDHATFELLRQIPRREFNPFHYRSDAISASMIIRKTSSKAELHAQGSATASKPKVKKSKKGLSAEHSLKSYAPILTSKRKKLV